MLDLHSVVVTLQGQLTISIEQGRIGDTKYII